MGQDDHGKAEIRLGEIQVASPLCAFHDQWQNIDFSLARLFHNLGPVQAFDGLYINLEVFIE